MIGVRIVGGFANQLFRYACAYSLANQYNQEIILFSYQPDIYTYANMLDELNIQEHKKVIFHLGNDLCHVSDDLLGDQEMQKELGYHSYIRINEKNFDCINEFTFNEFDMIFLDDNFQRKKYYVSQLENLKQIFTLRCKNDSIEQFKGMTENQNSVGVHFRRKDFVYLENTGNSDFGNSDDYYKASIAFLRDKISNPMFYIFSDDIDYAKKTLGNREDIRFVEVLGSYHADMEEFMCLALCKYRILAKGSSYGRLASILCNYKEAINIYYGNLNHSDNIFYISNEMILSLREKYDIVGYREDKQPIHQFDSYYLTADRKKELLFDRVRKAAAENDFKRADLLMDELWPYYNELAEFHKIYFELLVKKGRAKESLIELIAYMRMVNETNREINFVPDQEEVKQFIEQVCRIESINFIIAPQSPFSYYTPSDFINIGIVLRRLGFSVDFIFNKNKMNDDNSVYATFHKLSNYILENKPNYVNCRDYDFKCRMFSSDTDEDVLKKQINFKNSILLTNSQESYKDAYKKICWYHVDENDIDYSEDTKRTSDCYDLMIVSKTEDEGEKVVTYNGVLHKKYYMISSRLDLGESYSTNDSVIDKAFFILEQCIKNGWLTKLERN